MPVVYNMGSILGPAFGGALSNPYHRVPGTPAGPHLFEIFPYALPNVVIACFFMIGIIVGVLFLKETLPSRKNRKDIGLQMGENLVIKTRKFSRGLKHMFLRGAEEETKPLISTPSTGRTESISSEDGHHGTQEANEEDQKSIPTLRDVMSKQSCLNLAAYGVLCMHSLCYDQILPVFMHHPVQDISNPDVQLPFKFSGGFGIGKLHIL